jgi:hypothetical protein
MNVYTYIAENLLMVASVYILDPSCYAMFVTRARKYLRVRNLPRKLFIRRCLPIYDYIVSANFRPRPGLRLSSKERHDVCLFRVISRASDASLLASLKLLGLVLARQREHLTGVSYNIVCMRVTVDVCHAHNQQRAFLVHVHWLAFPCSL